MAFLLDTNVVSELRKRKPHGAVVAWIEPIPHLEDALIAATALVRDLTVATRNTDDFLPFAVDLINPFEQRR